VRYLSFVILLLFSIVPFVVKIFLVFYFSKVELLKSAFISYIRLIRVPIFCHALKKLILKDSSQLQIFTT